MRCTLSLALVLFAVFRPAGVGAYRYTHEVLPGENLRLIAKHYHVSVRTIRRLNRLRRGRMLRAYRRLKIVSSVPTRTRRRVAYSVRRRDTLSKIAKRYGMRLGLLRRLNRRRLRRRRTLTVGMRLWVVVRGPNPRGSVKGLFQLESGPGFVVRNPKRSWGSFVAVTRIADAFSAYARVFPRAPAVKIWDLSRRGGGFFRPHMSHRAGRDVDIPYVLKKRYKAFRSATVSNLDLKRTWFLLRQFIDGGDVKMIFINYRLQAPLRRYAARHGASKKFLRAVFQYPRGRKANLGVIRHEPGHATHFHVRFKREKRRKKTS